MRKRTWIILLIFIVALPIAYRIKTLRGQSSAESHEAALAEAVPVIISRISTGDLDEIASLTGNIEPIQSVLLISKVRGRVERIEKHIGDPVKAGETLAVIDPVDYALDVKRLEGVLAQARASNEQAQRDAARARQLAEDRVISTQALQASLSSERVSAGRVKEAEAAYDLARERLADTNVTSPIDGVIVGRYVDVGTTVDTQMMGNRKAVALYEIKNLNTVKLTVGISENDLPRARVGQVALIKLRAIPSRTFKGRLTHFSPSLAEGTRRAEAEIQIDNPEQLLKPGMFATAELILEHHGDVTLIPKIAVVERDGRQVVFLVEDDKARMTPVTLEGSDDRSVIVASGVKPGDQLIVRGQTLIEDGSPVRPEGEESDARAVSPVTATASGPS